MPSMWDMMSVVGLQTVQLAREPALVSAGVDLAASQGGNVLTLTGSR